MVEENSSTSLSLIHHSRGTRNTGTGCFHQNTHSCMTSKKQTWTLTYVGLGWCRRRENNHQHLTSMFYLIRFLWAQGGPSFGACSSLWLTLFGTNRLSLALTNPVLHKNNDAASVWEFEKPSHHTLQWEALKCEFLNISHDPYQQIIKCLNTNFIV